MQDPVSSKMYSLNLEEYAHSLSPPGAHSTEEMRKATDLIQQDSVHHSDSLQCLRLELCREVSRHE